MTKQIQIIPKNLVFPTARVLDKEDRELYQEASRKTAEKFGKDSRAYKTITNGIDVENITGSQFFWNTNLGFYLPKNQKVISLQDAEEINNLYENFFNGFYTDIPLIVLRTSTTSWKPNKQILENLVKQVKGEKLSFSSDNPLVISNLELVKDKNPKNEYGLLLKIGSETKMENDSRFAYSNDSKRIPFGEKQKTFYTQENGLSGGFLSRYSNLISGYSNLSDSSDYGRVVLKDAEGITLKNLLD